MKWIFNRYGQAGALDNGDCIYNRNGQFRLWISGNNLYDKNGRHVGWAENGIYYDRNNDVIGFLRTIQVICHLVLVLVAILVFLALVVDLEGLGSVAFRVVLALEVGQLHYWRTIFKNAYETGKEAKDDGSKYVCQT